MGKRNWAVTAVLVDLSHQSSPPRTQVFPLPFPFEHAGDRSPALRRRMCMAVSLYGGARTSMPSGKRS